MDYGSRGEILSSGRDGGEKWSAAGVVLLERCLSNYDDGRIIVRRGDMRHPKPPTRSRAAVRWAIQDIHLTFAHDGWLN